MTEDEDTQLTHDTNVMIMVLRKVTEELVYRAILRFGEEGVADARAAGIWDSAQFIRATADNLTLMNLDPDESLETNG